MSGKTLRVQVFRRMTRAGLSPASLAQSAGLRETTVQSILTGHVDRPNVYMIEALAGVFGCSVIDLVGNDPDFLPALHAWMEELYVSVTVDVDGDDPRQNSMLGLAAAAYTIDKRLVGEFAMALEPRAAADQSNGPRRRGRSVRLDAPTATTQSPATAMQTFAEHLDRLAGERRRPVFMGYPGAFDIRWLNSYFERYLHSHPLGISALCLKSFGFATLGGAFVSAASPPTTLRSPAPEAGATRILRAAIDKGAKGIDALRQYCGLAPIEAAV
jgi:transcriptional regulator with XRE-family HTH domain